jgi:phosphatidylglycerophosphate synthase
MGADAPGSWVGAASIVAIFVAIVLAYAVRSAVLGRRADGRLAGLGRSPFITRWLAEAFYWAMQAPGRLCVRLEIEPDSITWVALAIAVSATPFVATGHFLAGGALVLLAGAGDVLDGMVARARDRCSPAGAMLDAVLDRYADAAPLLGLAFFYQTSGWLLAVPLAALLGSFMQSYCRSKAEALGLLDLPSGMMRRHERTLYIGLALIVGPAASPLVDARFGPRAATLVLIGIVAVVGNLEAIRLAVAARRELLARPAKSEAKEA